MIQHTYDIFDTCLTRICGDPKDIFVLMAHRIFGNSCTDTQVNDFRYMRVKAEIEATDIHKESTRLTDIYNQLNFSAFTGLNDEQLIELECLTEEFNLRPIKKTFDEIECIHKAGGRIIYISDMYLPSIFLSKILKNFGFWKEGDTLYVSCECGCTKKSGKLFDYVEEKENLRKKYWMHHGDNKWSDIKMPRKKGIKVKYISTEYTLIQQSFFSLGLSTTTRHIQMMSGILRSLYHENPTNAVYLFAIDLIAPIYVPFVYNVLRDANNRKIKRLYFLARDGYIFYQIAEVFKPCFPDVEIHYLYVSRKSLYLPSLREVNQATLKSLIVDTKYSNIKEHIDNLQIKLNEEFYKQVELGMDPINVILQSPKYIKAIEQKIAEQRNLAVKYFEQEGLATFFHDTAIVDLRGTRRCQKCISDILVSAGYSRVFGYYLEAVHNRNYPISKDEYRAFMFGDNIAKNPLYYGLHIVKDVLEHYCSVTPFQRTSGYVEIDNAVEPVFDKDNLDSTNLKFIMNINVDICKNVAERFLRLGLEMKSDELLNLGLAGLASFMRKPSSDYLKALVNIKTSQTAYSTRSIIRKITPLSLFKHDVTWYEGSIKFTFGDIGLYLFNKVLPLVKRFYKWIR